MTDIERWKLATKILDTFDSSRDPNLCDTFMETSDVYNVIKALEERGWKPCSD